MTSRRIVRVALVSVCLICAVFVSPARTQAPAADPAAASAKATEPDPAKKAADLEEQVKTLQGQIAALAQRVPSPSAQDQNERAKAIYTEVFSKARDQAGPACRAAGGHLLVSVDLQANRATVACEWR